MQRRPLSSLRTDKCTTSCPLLDTFLRGGFPCGSITELAGEAAACKTQLCLQLLLSAAKPASQGGLGGKALYIYTEGDAPVKRLRELADYQQPSGLPSLLDSIYIEHHLLCPESLLESLCRASLLLRHPGGQPLRMIIIDSIAHLFRDPGDGEGALVYGERTAVLFQLAALLKRLADQHNLVVITTNQVVDVFDNAASGDMSSSLPPHTGGLRLVSSGREVIPALGLAWSNCVNSRFFLSRGPENLFEDQQGVLRCMQVVFSPALPQAYCYYRVIAEGVFGLPAASVEQAVMRRPLADSSAVNLEAPSAHVGARERTKQAKTAG